ncbi:MAG: fumarylacetoacetate hydrolase family protein [Opitutae bacterium]|nr:fumarylacetoacetate hydrolase family protein [Opitutae bacterium]
MKVYATTTGLVVETGGQFLALAPALDLDGLFSADDPGAWLRTALSAARTLATGPVPEAPLRSQEVWAAGVTYLRSCTARMAESQNAGGGTFYDKVYHAARPELFFKSTAHRVAAPGAPVRLRRDSRWNVPEPELTLALNARGRIFGYTVGNDMSSRDIEGENPLYLPQAKVYDRSAALGPCLLVTDTPPPPGTEILLEIHRAGRTAFAGQTTLGQIKRPFAELAEYLFRDNTFPRGCLLMTGTGIVPPDSFTLQSGDEIRITIPPIGTLCNPVA